MNITIKGRPITKKNGKTFTFRNGRTSLLSKESFVKYESDALRQLEKLGLTKITSIEGNRAIYTSPICFKSPVFIKYTFYIKGDFDVDTDNVEASINDILQRANILSNDNLIKHHYTNKMRGCDEFSTELEIYPADQIRIEINTPYTVEEHVKQIASLYERVKSR